MREIVIQFIGRRPQPQMVKIGNERENLAQRVMFVLPPDVEGSAVLHLVKGVYADVVTLDETLVFEPTLTQTQYPGKWTAYLEVLGENEMVWKSDVFYLSIADLPNDGEIIKKAFPNAFEEAVAAAARLAGLEAEVETLPPDSPATVETRKREDGKEVLVFGIPAGPAGADGYSPTITATAIDGGHQLTITDVNGTKTFDVMDGKGGDEVTADAVKAALGYTPASDARVSALEQDMAEVKKITDNFELFVPKFANTAEGETLVLTDSAEGALQGMTVYGHTTQDGTPTLDAPVPLVSVGDDGAVDVGVAGKNLLDASAYMQDVDGMIKIPYSSNNSIALEFAGIRVYRGQRYTFSYKRIEPTGDRVILMFLDRNGERIGDVDVGWGVYLAAYGGVYGAVGSGATFTIPQDSNVAYVQIRMCKMNTCGEGNYNYYYDLQLEVGSTATAYEPYKSPQTFTISTPNGLPSVGDVCDEIDLERGVYVQRAKRFSLPVANMNNSNQFPGWQRVEGLRDCVKAGVNGVIPASFRTNIGVTPLANTSNDNTNVLCYTQSQLGGLTQTELKTMYPDLVIEIMMPLLTPVETPLTAEEIAAFKALKTHYPTTTIYNDESARMTVKYAADTKNYIDNHLAALAAAMVNNL